MTTPTLSTRRAIARLAGTNTRTCIRALSAAELDREVGYKALGLTAATVKDLILQEKDRQAEVRRMRVERAAPKPPRPGRILTLMGDKQRNWSLTRQMYEGATSLADALASGRRADVRIGEWILHPTEDVEYDYERYSRTWHRSYGGAKSVSNRRVELLRPGALGAMEVVGIVPLESWRGHWWVRTVATLLDLPAVSRARSTERFGGEASVELHILSADDDTRVWARRVGGTVIGYSAARGGQICHGRTARGAVQALNRVRRGA